MHVFVQSRHRSSLPSRALSIPAARLAARERAEELVVRLLDVEQHLETERRGMKEISPRREGLSQLGDTTGRTCLDWSSVISSEAVSALRVISLSRSNA